MWILLLSGLALIGLEFFLPGGLIAFIGGSLVLGAMIWCFVLNIALAYKVGFFLVSILAVAGTCKLAIWMIRFKKRDELCLEESQMGYVASSFEKELIGIEGIAHTDLKPSGHIILNGVNYQASSEGEYIPKGRSIVVSGGRGAYLLVKEVLNNCSDGDSKRKVKISKFGDRN